MAAPALSLATCAAHGLAYDTNQHSGCVVCRRNQASPVPVGATAERSTAAGVPSVKKESVSRASRLFSGLRLLGGVVLAHHSALQMLTESLGTPTRGEVFYGTLGSLFPVAALAAVFMVVRSFRSLRGYSYAVLMIACLLAWGSL